MAKHRTVAALQELYNTPDWTYVCDPKSYILLFLGLSTPIFYQGELPQVTLCSSDTSHIWIPILLVYKAVELVFTLIFAFETRKVKVKELNDSKIIVFCVYTIVVSAIIFIPTTILLQNQPTAQYAVTGIVCLLTATVLLAITMFPK